MGGWRLAFTRGLGISRNQWWYDVLHRRAHLSSKQSLLRALRQDHTASQKPRRIGLGRSSAPPRRPFANSLERVLKPFHLMAFVVLNIDVPFHFLSIFVELTWLVWDSPVGVLCKHLFPKTPSLGVADGPLIFHRLQLWGETSSPHLSPGVG